MVFKVKKIELESIQFLAQSVGSGKTKAAIEGIRLKDDESHLFVAPTLKLSREIEERILRDLVNSQIVRSENVKLLTSDSVVRGESVKGTVLNQIRTRERGVPHVLIITTDTLRNILPELSINDKEHYNIYLDEGIDAIDRHEAKLGKLANEMPNLLDVDADTGRMSIKHGHKRKFECVAVGDTAGLGRDAHLCHLELTPIAKMLTCGLYDVFGVILENSVRCVGMLKPSLFAGFKSVTMIVAIDLLPILSAIIS